MNRKKIFCSIIIVCFSIYLISINQLIVKFDDSNSNYKIMESEENFESNSEVIFSMEASHINYNRASLPLTVEGWAFCESTDSAKNKEVMVLLKGNQINYVASADLISRDDVNKAFSDKSISSSMNGFEARIPTLTLKKDTYEVWLYVKENDVNHGIVDTGIVYEKSDTGFNEVKDEYRYKKIDDFSVYIEKDPVIQSVEKHDVNKGTEGAVLTIDGWAYCATQEDNDNKVVTVLLKGKKNTYITDTVLVERNDVADVHPEANGNLHGYRSVTPTAELKKDTYEVWIYVKENVYNYGLLKTDIVYKNEGGDFYEVSQKDVIN